MGGRVNRRQPGDPCPYCGEALKAELFEERRRRHSEGIKKALSEADEKGRRRSINYETVYTMRNRGMSINEITKALKCSRGAVQHALRVQAINTEEVTTK